MQRVRVAATRRLLHQPSATSHYSTRSSIMTANISAPALARSHRLVPSSQLIFHSPPSFTRHLLPCRSISSNRVRLHGGGHRHSHEADADHDEHDHSEERASTQSTPTPNIARRTLQQLGAILKHYSRGCKLLWRNHKKSRRIIRELAPGSVPSRSDLLHLQHTRADLVLGVPFVLLFAIPIVGYAAPLFAHFMPRYVPSTLRTPHQVKEIMRQDAKKSQQAIRSAKEMFSFHPQACALSKLRELLRRLSAGTARVDSLNELTPLAPLFERLCPSASQLPRSHLILLHQSIIHSGIIARYLLPRSMLVNKMRRWRQHIEQDDKRLREHPQIIEQLSAVELAQALEARGIYRWPKHMAAVIVDEHTKQLEDTDKPESQEHQPTNTPPDASPTSSSKSSLLPTPDYVVSDWRSMLNEWVRMHHTLAEQVEQAKSKQTHNLDSKQTNTNTDANANVNSPSKTSAQDEAAGASAAASSSASASSLTPLTSFPFTFFIHLPALAWRPDTQQPIATSRQVQGESKAEPPSDHV